MTTLKVLIADDEEATCDVIQELAEWEKYNMEVIAKVSNGQEALSFIRKNHVDVLITDMNMPSMNGGQLLKIVSDQYREIKTIVVSGYDDFRYLQSAIRSQSIDYLLKPISSDELNYALEKTMISWKVSQFKKPLSISKINKVLVPELKNLRKNISFVIEKREKKQLQLLFKELRNEVNSLIKSFNDPIIIRIYYEQLILYLEEQLYTHNLSLEELNVTKKQLSLDPEASVDQMIKKLEGVFRKLIKYLINFKQENSSLSLLDVKEYIDRNYKDQGITLSKVAEEFHVTQEYLSKAFKSKFKVNFTEYILQRRMEKAKDKISKDGMQIKHAAEFVGYEDISYFYRVWRRYFGFPPGKLKKYNKKS